MEIAISTPSLQEITRKSHLDTPGGQADFGYFLENFLLEKVNRPGQYLGNEWNAKRKSWNQTKVRLALTFPDLYELGMSNFGLKILYEIVNSQPEFLADRSYAPEMDMEALLRQYKVPLWALESRQRLNQFDLIGFSLQYELTYTNVLNMLELAQIPVKSQERESIFPLIFGGGPSSVNPEPMALFMDFFIIGDGEEALPAAMKVIEEFKQEHDLFNSEANKQTTSALRHKLLLKLATSVPGVYVPSLYRQVEGKVVVEPISNSQIPKRVFRQVVPLSHTNQPTKVLVPYLSLVHDREVIEVRRGCDRGCRFCQPGYTFLPVRERSTKDLLDLSTQALKNSGNQEYSMLSLCVSDYTALHDSVRALNREHAQKRASMSFPSQRADRMNLDIAEELKVVRKSGITLAPEAGTERLRAVINKGLNHGQIINAIESAYASGWSSIKLYFMIGLPTETDEDLQGIIDILKEATNNCRAIRKQNMKAHKRDVELTCTISNTVPKPFTPFQWYSQTSPEETTRKQQVLRQYLRESGLRNIKLNFTDPNISMMEAVISRGGREAGNLIYEAWKLGAVFDAWDEHLKIERWQEASQKTNLNLREMASGERVVGSDQPWDIVHIGLNNWWLVNEWKKAVNVQETAPCTENKCHACGVCTELDTNHELAAVKVEVQKSNPFVRGLEDKEDDNHPSLFFQEPAPVAPNTVLTRIQFKFSKQGLLRFISHLDLQHLFIRACRRANINVSHTEGFSPSPKLALAQPLPLFQEGLAEVGDIELAQEMNAKNFMARVNEELPPEVRILDAAVVEPNSKSLAGILGGATYIAHLNFFNSCGAKEDIVIPQDIAQKALSSILDSESLLVPVLNTDGTQSGKQKDIRPGIRSIKLANAAGSKHGLSVELELASGSKLHVKPTDVLRLLEERLKGLFSNSETTSFSWFVSRTGLTNLSGQPLFQAKTSPQNL